MTTLFSAIMVMGILRKVLIFTSALTNNAGSFVNQTARRLHIIISDISGLPESTAGAIGDASIASLDEVPTIQARSNDSRSHIQSASAQVIGGTGAIEAVYNNSSRRWNRNDLVLDPDEALFLNIEDTSGALDVGWAANLFYET